MRVNMFKLRFTSELHPRWKNGHPAHNTTGVLRIAWIPNDTAGGTTFSPGECAVMARRNTGTASAAPNFRRRVISRSSAVSSSATGSAASSAMPHCGQVPG